MRSPYGEFIAKKIVSELKKMQLIKEELSFKSGVVTYQNGSIHPLTEKFLIEDGINKNQTNRHQARLVDNYPEYFSETKLFIAMTNEHRKILNKKGYLNNYLLSEVANKGQEEILDPYLYPEIEEEIFANIKEYTKRFIYELVKL
ncbi:MAG: hypothetical protein HeimC3_23960 [Candidatus Heimdallarchaeota archaeon LC_3]|nr:MAG: hypothetical protein HeimC3_23960 [Candidatus Heimdallarchaeota archaeon LC_3]